MFDTLARVGLFGFIPYFMMHMALFSFVKRMLPPLAQWNYVVVGVSLFVFLVFKSNALMIQNLMLYFLLPSLLVWREDLFFYTSKLIRQNFGYQP